MQAERSTALEGSAFVLSFAHFLTVPALRQSSEWRWAWWIPALLGAVYLCAGLLRNRPPHRRILPRVLFWLALLVTVLLVLAVIAAWLLISNLPHIT